MEYRVMAFKCKVNSVIELGDNMIPAGSIHMGEDIFILCLDPLEERKLSEEPPKPEEEKVQPS